MMLVRCMYNKASCSSVDAIALVQEVGADILISREQHERQVKTDSFEAVVTCAVVSAKFWFASFYQEAGGLWKGRETWLS